jgi:hypothetical protein
MILYGVNKPKVENHESLSHFLEQINIDPSNLYCCNDSITYNKLIEIFSSAPDAEIFDANGFLIPYKDGKNITCNAGLESFINKIIKTKQLATSFDGIEKRLSCIVNSKNKEAVSFESLPKSDYYILFYFMKWMGNRMNREHLTSWCQQVDTLNSENKRITYLIISLDFIDPWGKEYVDLPMEFNPR